MIMEIHVPFSDLANMQVAFKAANADYACYGIEDGKALYWIDGNASESEENLICLAQRTGVRFRFIEIGEEGDRNAQIYRDYFGEAAFNYMKCITPESVGIGTLFPDNCLI